MMEYNKEYHNDEITNELIKSSFYKMLCENKIEIPIYQRDFVYGRIDEDTETRRVRRDIIGDILWLQNRFSDKLSNTRKCFVLFCSLCFSNFFNCKTI